MISCSELGDDEVADDTIKNHAAFIWSVADLLRGDYKQSECGHVIVRAQMTTSTRR